MDATHIIPDREPEGEPRLEVPATSGWPGPGAGFGSFGVAIPDDDDLQEAEWFGRWYVDDVGGGFPAAVSKVFRFRTFRGRELGDIFADGVESGDACAWDAVVP